MNRLASYLGDLAIRLGDLDSKHAREVYTMRDAVLAAEDPKDKKPEDPPSRTPEEWDAFFEQQVQDGHLYRKPTIHKTKEVILEDEKPAVVPPPEKDLARELLDSYMNSLKGPPKGHSWDAPPKTPVKKKPLSSVLDEVAQKLDCMGSPHTGSVCQLRDVLAETKKAPAKTRKKTPAVEAPPAETAPLAESTLRTRLIEDYGKAMQEIKEKSAPKPSHPPTTPQYEDETVQERRRRLLGAYLDTAAQVLANLNSLHVASVCEARDVVYTQIPVDTTLQSKDIVSCLDRIASRLDALGVLDKAAQCCAARDAVSATSSNGSELVLRMIPEGAILEQVVTRSASLPKDWVPGVLLTKSDLDQLATL